MSTGNAIPGTLLYRLTEYGISHANCARQKNKYNTAGHGQNGIVDSLKVVCSSEHFSNHTLMKIV